MSERELVRRSLPLIRKKYNTNFVTKELTLFDGCGYFRPDVTLVSDRRWSVMDVRGIYYAHRPEYYDLPIGQDMKFVDLNNNFRLSQWSIRRLIDMGLLERVRRGYYMRHQPTPLIKSELIMFEFKAGMGGLNNAITQTSRYRETADVSLIALPFDLDNLNKLASHEQLEFAWEASPLVMVFKVKPIEHSWLSDLIATRSSRQAYVLGKIQYRYSERWLDEEYSAVANQN